MSYYALTVRLIGINKVFGDIPCAHEEVGGEDSYRAGR